jgi:hypothetical protein
MPTADRNDLMPAQEKLEWVTPKISLMEAVDTEAKRYNFASEWHPTPSKSWTFVVGPS